MELHRSAAADPRLASFVRCFGQREPLPSSAAITQPHIATLGPILSFDLGERAVITRVGEKPCFYSRTHLLGTQTRYVGHTCLNSHALQFGIFFRTFALWQLFGIPPAELVNRDEGATEIIGSWTAELWSRLVEASNFSKRVIVATEALLPLVTTASPLTSTMLTVRRLLPSDEAARIHQVARESAMSIRNYERKFSAEMGFSPKTFARLARFEKAVDLKRAAMGSWLNISHNLGYFDQMHMIRDFLHFGGETPARLVLPNSDFQPWSIRNPSRDYESSTGIQDNRDRPLNYLSEP